MSNGSPDIQGYVKSQWKQCKFGIFSKCCISFGQECMVLNLGVLFNSEVFQVIFQKWFYIKILNHLEKPTKYRRACREKITWYFVLHDLIDMHNLKLWENSEEFWNGVFCMLSLGTLVKWCMKLDSLNYILRKKKSNFPMFLRGEFSLFYLYSNFWIFQENHEQFSNGVFCTLLPRACSSRTAIDTPNLARA